MSNYLIELGIIHTLLLLGYLFLLRNEKQYGKMRFFLIGAALAALIIPLLKLTNPFLAPQVLVPVSATQLLTFDTNTTAEMVAETNWMLYIAVGAYLSVSLFFLYRFIESVSDIIRLKQRSHAEKYQFQVIHRVDGIKGSFSFLNWIFLSEEITQDTQDYDIILKHEKAHVKLGHSYDLLFFELLKVCFWWLPFVWYSINELKKIHEYQADAYALKWCNIDHYSSILISSTLKTSGLGLASSFHDSLILKRLKAMKEQKRSLSKWKTGSLTALLTITFMVFACTEQPINAQEKEDEIFTFVEEWPEYPGGMDALYQYVSQEIKYPKAARTSGVEGQIWVQVIIEKDGRVSNVETVKGIGGGCDEEGERVLKSIEQFKPAKQRGKAVRIRMAFPIVFQINNDQSNPDGSPQGVIIVNKAQNILGEMEVNAKLDAGEWNGTVLDETGYPMPGANIIVEGTTSGTVSDLDGTFSIKATGSKDIAISFVGYKTVKLTAEQ
ncbi:MAG: TonB family protein [Cyclobacteriaceae bacterium]